MGFRLGDGRFESGLATPLKILSDSVAQIFAIPASLSTRALRGEKLERLGEKDRCL
jgi:hypothetical protein